jgi:hypothetical protein
MKMQIMEGFNVVQFVGAHYVEITKNLSSLVGAIIRMIEKCA